jgi:hypothetical protein
MPNPSKFGVYSVIRSNYLERKTKLQKSLDNENDVGHKGKIDANIILNEGTYQENNKHAEPSAHHKSANIDKKYKGSQVNFNFSN